MTILVTDDRMPARNHLPLPHSLSSALPSYPFIFTSSKPEQDHDVALTAPLQRTNGLLEGKMHD
ncbi:uncharacterized protein EAF01_005531 [Botrytis porri]|uniref:uncharacterized protein n=1 Tax=Botrytis porri TaxID=87229 RepID=UPI001902A291|nr:uncharacterized protein EAF01_005531 [Botrytis porri]KAF7905009.1 hypothetical protein EAF01_005531 [Botrytis porri]